MSNNPRWYLIQTARSRFGWWADVTDARDRSVMRVWRPFRFWARYSAQKLKEEWIRTYDTDD